MRRFLKLVGLALALFLLASVFRGLLLSRYVPERSENYLWGAFHVHSDLSDGLGDLTAVARQASASRVDFVLLSDHGTPHPQASLLDETIDGVRFIGGSEVGLPEGHLILISPDRVPRYTLPPYPPDAVAEARDWGAFSVLTYPEDPRDGWHYWEPDFAPDGMEIINVTSYFRASSHWQKLVWAFFSMFVREYYVSVIRAPDYALERWDAFLERAPVFALYAVNAHGGFTWRDRPIELPSYGQAFSYVGIGVARQYRDDPEQAVRAGDFFSIVRGAGEPRRFDFAASKDDQSYPMGSFVDAPAVIEAKLEVGALSPKMVLKRDGVQVRESDSGLVRLPNPEPGVYRLEVYLRDHPLLAEDVPWILSNPIFVGIDYESLAPARTHCEAVVSQALGELGVETDDESRGKLRATDAGALELSYELSQATEETVDRWVALALRKPLDLSSYDGVTIEATAGDPMRYWLELRSGDESYYASFELGPEHEPIVVPWTHFYQMFGTRERVPEEVLAQVDALFITVNTSNSRTGFASGFELEKLGWCVGER